MKLILLGAPGAGKGTQAEIISKEYAIPAISTGNMIRDEVKSGSALGLEVKSYLDTGALVPDEVIIKIIRERLSKEDCQNGYILDGVPRTVPQAEALKQMGIETDAVLEIHVRDEDIQRRLGGRRVCGDCGASYHLQYNPPETEGACGKCGGALIIRKDDKPEVIADRLDVYHRQTEPLKDYYRKEGKLIVVEGQEELAETTRLTLEALASVGE